MSNPTIDSAPEAKAEFSLHMMFQKTPRGYEEIKTRRLGLAPKTRQLLILVDGHRSIADLLKVMPEAELRIQLDYLSGYGLIERLDTAQSFAPAPGNTIAPPTFAPTQSQAVPVEPSISLEVAKARISRAVIETMGPNGETFSMRIEKAQDFQEVRELLTSLAPVVEAFGGRATLQSFVQRVGKIF
jgi:hypothetical protein